MGSKGNPNWRKGGPSPNPTGKRRDAAPTGEAKIAALATQVLQRTDGYHNAITGMGGKNDKAIATEFCADIVDAYTAEQIWRGDPIGARLVEMRATDATSEQPELCIGDYEAPEYYDPDAALEGEEPAPKKRKDARVLGPWERRVVQAIGRQRRRADAMDTKSMSEEISHHLGPSGLKACEAIRQGIQYREAYGGSVIYIGANDYATDLRQPLELKRVRSLDYLTPLECREITPLFNYDDPFQPNFGRPAIYQLTPYSTGSPLNPNTRPGVTQIHESRLIVFDGPRVSRRQLSGTLPGWGDSVYTRVYRALRSYASAVQNIDVLLSSFAQAIYKIKGLAAALLQNPNALTDAMMAVELCRSMINAVVLDEGEEFSRQSVSLNGYPEMLERLAINVAAAAGMPITRLFGTSAKGMNATGENDEAFYFAGVSKIQTHEVAPAYLRLVEIEMAIRGEDPAETTHSIAFKPLYKPSEKEIAETRKIVAETDQIYMSNYVVSPEEVALNRFGGDGWSMETSIDIEARAEGMAVLPPAVEAQPEPEQEVDENGDPIEDMPDPNDGEDVDGEEDGYDDIVTKYTADMADVWHEDKFNPHQKRGPNGRWLPGGGGAKDKPAEGGGRAAPAGRAKGGTGGRKPPASKAAPAPKPAKAPSASSYQKSAGVSSKSKAGQALKALAHTGQHEKAAAMVEEIKMQRVEKAARKQALAEQKAQRAAKRMEREKARAEQRSKKAEREKARAEAKAKAEAEAKAKAEAAKQFRERLRAAAEKERRQAEKEAAKKQEAPDAYPTIADNGKASSSKVMSGLLSDSITDDAAKAMRDASRDTLSAFGIKQQKNLPDVDTVTIEALQGAAANVDHKGHMRIDTDHLGVIANYHDQVARHGRTGGTVSTRDWTATGANILTHEQLHLSGPIIPYRHKGIYADELATEMASRHITAHVHGFDPHDFHTSKRGGYGHDTERTVSEMLVIANKYKPGVSVRDVHNAIARSALELKQRDTSEHLQPEHVFDHISRRALHHLGIKNESAAAESFRALDKQAGEFR